MRITQAGRLTTVGSSIYVGENTGNETFTLGNSGFGADVLSNASGVSGLNSGFGYQALRDNTDGSQNSAFGSFSLRSNTLGLGNSA